MARRSPRIERRLCSNPAEYSLNPGRWAKELNLEPGRYISSGPDAAGQSRRLIITQPLSRSCHYSPALALRSKVNKLSVSAP